MEHMKVIVTISQTERYTNYAGNDSESHDDIVLTVGSLENAITLISALEPKVDEIGLSVTVVDYDHRDPKPEISEDGDSE
jgi:hypothetical protein